MNRLTFFGLAFLSLSTVASAKVRVNPIFQSNMVLPQRADVPIWGIAAPGELVTVSSTFAPTVAVVTGSDGKWRVSLLTPRARTGDSITITGTNQLVLTSVSMGEVWLVCGQSNMEKTLSPTAGVPDVKNAQAEIAAANWPNLKLFMISRLTTTAPVAEVKGLWETCTPSTVGKFSAIGYFFGRDLHQSMQVPVGIVSAVKGGTAMEEWMSAAAIARTGSSFQPSSSYYNGMIAPLIPFPFRGVLVYAGEGNVSRPTEVGPVWREWITSWRQEWGTPALPIYHAQIAPYAYSAARKGGAAVTREGQASSLDLANTGMVVLSDTVEDINNIHPIDKQTPGARFMQMALGRYYKRSGVVSMGPIFKSVSPDGSRLRVYFDNSNNGLTSPDTLLPGFEIAGADKVYRPARAIIERGAVTVSSDLVPKPLYVRQGWADAYSNSLFNGYGLPSAPFRSDRSF